MDPFVFIAVEQVVADENNIVFDAGGGFAAGAGFDLGDDWDVAISYSLHAPETIGFESPNATVGGNVTVQTTTFDLARRLGGPVSVGAGVGYGLQTYDLDGLTQDERAFAINETVSGLAYRLMINLDAPDSTPLFASVVYTSSTDRNTPMEIEGEEDAFNPGINRSYAVRVGARFGI